MEPLSSCTERPPPIEARQGSLCLSPAGATPRRTGAGRTLSERERSGRASTRPPEPMQSDSRPVRASPRVGRLLQPRRHGDVDLAPADLADRRFAGQRGSVLGNGRQEPGQTREDEAIRHMQRIREPCLPGGRLPFVLWGGHRMKTLVAALLLAGAGLPGCSSNGDDCGQGLVPRAGCPCPSGTTACHVGPGVWTCADLRNDPSSCGQCFFTCGRGVCIEGDCYCAPPPVKYCPKPPWPSQPHPPGPTLCVDTATDPSNCGDCGASCTTDQTCMAGQCL